MKKEKNLDELFREKFLLYEQEPPAYLLENILAGAAGARRKKKLVFWRLTGVAAAILLAFVAGWQLNYLNNETAVQPIVVSRSNSPEIKTGITAQVVTEPKKLPGGMRETQAIPENSGKLMSDKKRFAANQIFVQEKTTSTETAEYIQNEGSNPMKPLNKLTILLSQNDLLARVLHEKTKGKTNNEQAEKSIDQQIMEQNQQMALAKNDMQKKGRWLVGAQVSPEYSVSRSSHSQVYASNMLNSSSVSPVDLGGGLSVEFKKGKRWSLQSGVYYSGLGQSSGNSAPSNGKDYAFADAGSKYFNAPVNIEANTSKMMMNTNAGVIEFNSVPSGIMIGTNLEDRTMGSAVVVSDTRFIQNFEYIEIPLYLRYTLLDSRFDIEMLGGFSSNLLVGNETYVESASGKSLVGKTNDMETLNYSGTLGIGLKYGLSKRIFLNVEPRVKYFLNSLNNNSSVTYKPYTIGVFSGLSYQF